MCSRLLFFTVAIATITTLGCGRDRDRGPVSGVDGSIPGADGGVPGVDAGPGIDSGPRPDGGPMPMPGMWVDPGCLDGMYAETLPDTGASIDDLVSGYSSASYQTFVDQVLERRYPIGAAIVRGGRSHTEIGGDCVDRFLSDRTSADNVIGQLSTVVHECGHFFDLGEGDFSNAVFVIRPDLMFSCNGGDAVERGGQTFARSRINGDAYAALRPACGGTGGSGCDFYADVYLDGDPDDGSFDGGDQGFDSLLEETAQYVNSLGTSYAFVDRSGGGRRTSARDGILTFLWYVGRYLRMARTDYPAAYEHLAGTDCWRRAILTVWGRAWLFLEATDGMSALGINDAEIFDLATHADMLTEIEMLRSREGC